MNSGVVLVVVVVATVVVTSGECGSGGVPGLCTG